MAVAYSAREEGASDVYFAVALYNWVLDRFVSTYLASSTAILATSLEMSLTFPPTLAQITMPVSAS
jgi:hypothetical protein